MGFSLDYRWRRWKRGTLARMALLSSRFAHLLPPSAPLARMDYRGSERNPRLILFLPGIGDLAEDFERMGFIDDMRQRGVTADAVAADAHFGYYAGRMIHERITADLIDAAQEDGYEQIWLAGISLGGFGAASYAARHATHVSGLILLAPYLGRDPLIREITQAGGIRRWQPGHVRESDHERTMWRWFRQHLSGVHPMPRIYLGYGESDRFAPANALLADALPREHVFSIPGGHDWRTWKRLWHLFLGVRENPLR